MITNKESNQQLLLHFDAELSRLRFDLLHELGSIDVLNGTQRDHAIKTFCQRLEIMEFDFLRMIAPHRNPAGSDPSRPKNIKAGINPCYPVAAGAGLGGGYAAAHAAQVIVLETLSKGFWIWKTTADITIAAKVALLLGISAAHSVLLIGILCGLPAYFLTQKLTRPVVAKLIRRLIIRQYDNTIVPQLRDWAKGQLSKV